MCTKGYESREQFQVFHGESGRLVQELPLNEYSRSVRMRSRKTAKMLANHEEFPAASLSPKLNQ